MQTTVTMKQQVLVAALRAAGIVGQVDQGWSHVHSVQRRQGNNAVSDMHKMWTESETLTMQGLTTATGTCPQPQQVNEPERLAL